MFVFLQSWRATLIPGIAIPVVLLGTFGMLYILGFSINTLTLFGLVLAVGLLVDDAIVVVENVERILHEQPELTVKEATIISMQQIQMALVAIALVLSAVFLPMVFFGGSTGVIYRQFSATIVSAMALSVVLAITFSPSLAANVLRRQHASVEETWLGRRAPAPCPRHRDARASASTTAFSAPSTGTSATSAESSSASGCSSPSMSASACCWWCFTGGFRPASSPPRTRAMRSVQFRLPAGATSGRTQEVERTVEKYFLHGPEKKNIHTFFAVTGGGGGGASGQNTGQAYHEPRAVRRAQGQREQRRSRSSTAPPARSAAFAMRRCSRWFPARSAASASRPASRWSCRTRAG